MALIVFLTGLPGVGKSTIVRQVAEKMIADGVKVGGMTSVDIRSGAVRLGFEVRDLVSGEAGILAHVSQQVGPRIGRYRVNSEDLDRIGAGAIARAIEAADLIVIDEVGPMELTSERFRGAVKAAVDCGKHVLGTVHRNAQDPMVMAVKSRPGIEVVKVTTENRDALTKVLVERFKTAS